MDRVDDHTGDVQLIRSTPSNLEVERQLLGSLLLNNETYYRVEDFLKSEHFYLGAHQNIFDQASQLIKSGKTVSPIILKSFLPSDLHVGDMPIFQYLMLLTAEATTVINAEDYGRLIHDLAIRRSLIVIGEDMVNSAYEVSPEESATDQIENTEQRLFELAETGRYDSGFVTFSQALKGSVEMAASAYQRVSKLSGIATGLTSLDRMMGGMQPADLIVIAGRPAMGKTSLATNIAFNAASAYAAQEQSDGVMKTIDGAIVGFFSLEMSYEQLATRIISEQTEIPSNKIRRGNITEIEFEKIVAFSQDLSKIPLYVDQTGGISISQLATRARRLKRQRGLDILIVDYLQLLFGSSRNRQMGRVQEITEITTRLKALAKELNTPIIALSQLSRQVEGREDKRPQLADLRESGSIEQDADVVIFVYRDEYYLKNQEPSDRESEDWFKWESEMSRVKGLAELIVGKQRHGPTGVVEVHFSGEHTRFSDLVRTDRPSFTLGN